MPRASPQARSRHTWWRSYDTEVSRETISKITDEIVSDMTAWQNRPLDAVYPVLLIDAIVVKVRGAQVANRPVYVAIGVNLAGERDVLGLWLGPTGGEGAKQWATMLTELRNRGLADALIVCCDGLRGLPESIRAAWPEATVQTCVVHMVRNSLRYASRKHWGLWVPKTRSWALTCNDASAHTLTLGCPKSSETRNPGMSSMSNRLSERGRDGRDVATVRDQAR